MEIIHCIKLYTVFVEEDYQTAHHDDGENDADFNIYVRFNMVACTVHCSFG